jgi:glycosyltransferase EpsD
MNDKKIKILFVASIDLHIISFHLPYLKFFIDKGFDVHVACNGYNSIPYCSKVYHIDFDRSVLSFEHFRALKQLKIILDCEKYDFLHCHTSIASVLTRIAAYKFRRDYGLCVIYTAHGFPFFKGSTFINWFVYFPIELATSIFTDYIITINQEDYRVVKKYFFSKEVKLIPGMGVDINRFHSITLQEKNNIRIKFGIHPCEKVLVYVAEFITRKNHKLLLSAAKKVKEVIPELRILMPGRGILLEEMKLYAEQLGISYFVSFPGYIQNVETVFSISDLCVSCSRREGLGLHIIEAMMCGLPIVATDISGHRELVSHNVNGFLYSNNDQKAFIKYIILILSNSDIYERMSLCAKSVSKRFELQLAKQKILDIYNEII